MTKPRILIQLDTDSHPSSFDAVVACDAGAERLVQYGGVTPGNVEGLVHGAMFTRGPEDLKNTAIFVGGSDVVAGEAVYDRVRKCFFGPMRVSVMLDANGCNTTAAAAVLRAAKHLDLAAAKVLVLAGTGPVGQRVARLLLGAGANVLLSSRQLDRATQTCAQIAQRFESSDHLMPCEGADAIDDCDAVIACGAAGVELLTAEVLARSSVRLAIDLNAVPPVGIEGIDIMDRAKDVDGRVVYGAIGVGGTKMKIHHAAIEQMFTRNDCELDAESIFKIGQEV